MELTTYLLLGIGAALLVEVIGAVLAYVYYESQRMPQFRKFRWLEAAILLGLIALFWLGVYL